MTFRAGLELGVMNRSLAALSWVRQWVAFPISNWMVSAAQRAATWLERFGTDVGGMVVNVTIGRTRHCWRLLASGGDGPYIPTTPARAILRNPDQITAGARPALAELPLADFEAAMSDLDITFETQSIPIVPLFEKHLGPAFDVLPAEVRDSHVNTAPRRLIGRASVTRGPGFLPTLIATLFRFPKAADDVQVEVLKTSTPAGETWVRTFAHQSFVSHLATTPNGMTERFGLFTFTLGLTPTDEHLAYPVRAAHMGPIPIPRRLSPQSDALETVQNGRFHFDVKLSAPVTGQTIVHYQGWLVPSGLSNRS